jgi:alpha-amylase
MDNITIMQHFHWYYPADGSLWKKVSENAAALSKIGITSLWLPPASKGADGAYANGYDTYDLWDLGEFDQKGSVRTKYGTRQEYEAAIKAAHENNMGIIADVVLNHKAAGDEKEKFTVIRMNPDNRVEKISEPFEIESWTKFTFPGRNGTYSSFIWDHHCFSGVDCAADLDEKGVFSIQNEYGEGWEDGVADELGSYDFLMCNDISPPSILMVFVLMQLNIYRCTSSMNCWIILEHIRKNSSL